MWEKAQIGWHLRESLPEFEDREPDEQLWLIATWRSLAKISAIEALETWRKRSK